MGVVAVVVAAAAAAVVVGLMGVLDCTVALGLLSQTANKSVYSCVSISVKICNPSASYLSSRVVSVLNEVHQAHALVIKVPFDRRFYLIFNQDPIPSPTHFLLQILHHNNNMEPL